MVSKINYKFAKDIEFIDDVILYNTNDFPRTLQDIKSKNFDASIGAYIDTQLGKILYKSGIKKSCNQQQN